MKLKNLSEDKKGLSPVLGVILMVAITVILAAVIAAFVFGLSEPNKKSISDKEEFAAVTYYDGGETGGRLYIEESSPSKVEAIIAKINKNGCAFTNEGPVQKNPKINSYYASGPVGPCGKKYK